MESLNKLLELQQEYLQRVFDEDPHHSQVLQEYIELIELIKTSVRRESMKYAKAIVNNQQFAEAFVTKTASLYIPILSLLQMLFRGHRHLSTSLLIKARPQKPFFDILSQVFEHMDLAYESLREDLYPNEAISASEDVAVFLYGFEESMLILDITIKWIKSLMEQDEKLKITSMIVQRCPRAANCLLSCSSLIASHDLEKIASDFNLAVEDVAARVIQSAWRTVLESRKWKKLRRGVILFQIAFRKHLFAKEARVMSELDESEQGFNLLMKNMIQSRNEIEKLYSKIKSEPARSIHKIKWKQITDLKTKKEPTISFKNDDVVSEEEKAAIVIQRALRQWKMLKIRKLEMKKNWYYFENSIHEDRRTQLQEEIIHWQHKNQVHVNPFELNLLTQKSQAELTKWISSQGYSKRRDQRIKLKSVQTHAIASLLETAPSLKNYNPEDWKNYHSFPLHIAVKARLEHKSALEFYKMPSWKKTLMMIDEDDLPKSKF